MRTDELDYDLPARLIAMRPAEPRDDARLLVVRRDEGPLEHRRVRDLPGYVGPGDVLVFNDTSVVPARLLGRRAGTGGRVEGLFLDAIDDSTWCLMLERTRRLRPGSRIELLTEGGAPAGCELRLIERAPAAGARAAWIAHVEPSQSPDEAPGAFGLTPLPPYIRRARDLAHRSFNDADDRRWYETTYADPRRRRSVAAPTAGLHFTPDLLAAIDARGAHRTTVTLHVGPGTFLPITAETIEAHLMHGERYDVPAATLDALRAARAREGTGGRVLAVGTTSVRTLESLPDPLPAAAEGESLAGETDLLIAPPYLFHHVDGMLTNFHLPRSTLLALVAAMVGLDRLRAIYAEAVRREYRFYSYGDAMLVL